MQGALGMAIANNDYLTKPLILWIKATLQQLLKGTDPSSVARAVVFPLSSN